MALNLTKTIAAALAAGTAISEIETRAAGLHDLSALRDLRLKPDGWLSIATRAQLLDAAALFTAETWRRRASRKKA